MAEALPRRSKRKFKPKLDSEFEFDEEVIDALSGRRAVGASFENESTVNELSRTATVDYVSDRLASSFSELDIVPQVINYKENTIRTVQRVITQSEVEIIHSPLRFVQGARPTSLR